MQTVDKERALKRPSQKRFMKKKFERDISSKNSIGGKVVLVVARRVALAGVMGFMILVFPPAGTQDAVISANKSCLQKLEGHVKLSVLRKLNIL